jgi:dienelactone hydrolase
VVHLHGNQGNFTVGALRYLPEPVAAAGVPVLSLEMRVGNVSQLFGGALFEEALVDVRAGVEWLLAHGFDHVVVSGYSMGAVVAVAFGAGLDGGPLGMLRGVAGAGTAWSTPEATHRRMHEYRAAPSYAELVERCRPPAGDPSLTDPVVVVDRAFGPEDHPRYAGVYTARTWWHFRGPEARMAMPGRHIGAITAPVLLIQGTADTLVRPEEADRLADAARQGGNQDVQVSLLEGATHAFSHHEEELVSVLAPWVVRVA